VIPIAVFAQRRHGLIRMNRWKGQCRSTPFVTRLHQLQNAADRCRGPRYIMALEAKLRTLIQIEDATMLDVSGQHRPQGQRPPSQVWMAKIAAASVEGTRRETAIHNSNSPVHLLQQDPFRRRRKSSAPPCLLSPAATDQVLRSRTAQRIDRRFRTVDDGLVASRN